MSKAKAIRREGQANAAADLRKIAARARKLADGIAPKTSLKQIWDASFSAADDENEGYIRTGQTARRLGIIDKEKAAVIILAGIYGVLEDRVASDKALKQIILTAKATVTALEIFPSDDPELIKIEKAIEAAAKAHGLKEDEDWPDGEEPEDVKKLIAAYSARFPTPAQRVSYERLSSAWNRRLKRIVSDVLQEHGEGELADAVMADLAGMGKKGIRGQVN